MIKITERITADEVAQESLTLTYELRQKSRFKAQLDNGIEVGLFLDRGKTLHHGDLLKADNQWVIKINAAPEKVSTVYCNDALTMAKLSYHLGNRHVPLQINNKQISYLQDHVLDQMVEHLGGTVQHKSAKFEPESGAYHTHNHSDSHNNNHGT